MAFERQACEGSRRATLARKKEFTIMFGGGIGQGELLLLLLIVLLIFGPKNLPRLAQSIGRSARELKNGLSGITDDLKDSVHEDRKKPAGDSTVRRPEDTPVERTEGDHPHRV